MPKSVAADGPWGDESGARITPAKAAVAVTPNDSTDLTVYAKALYIGTGGTVVCIPTDNLDAAPITFVNCQDGSILPVRVRRVLTASTAQNIVALLAT